MWDAYLFHFTSGQLGPRLQPEDASWSISLNESEELRINLKKSDLPDLDLNTWFDPWYAGVVLTYDGTPIVGGPIINHPTQSQTEIHLQCGGVRHLLAKRMTVREMNDWSKLSKQVVSYNGLSLGTIAKKVVQLVQQKPGGNLPIDFPYADQTAAQDADHERNYRSFNVANLSAHDILTKLSNVIDGPDIMFRPKFVSIGGTVSVRFDMVYGSERLPRIPQKLTAVWDATAANGPIANIQIVTSGSYQTHRVFAVGAGEDEGTLIRVAENLDKTAKGYPLLETVYPNSNSENASVVQGHAQGSLNQNYNKLQELSLSVRANAEPVSLGTYFVGDEIRIYTKGWIGFKDGEHKARLLAISGKLNNDLRLSVQLEERV